MGGRMTGDVMILGACLLVTFFAGWTAGQLQAWNAIRRIADEVVTAMLVVGIPPETIDRFADALSRRRS